MSSPALPAARSLSLAAGPLRTTSKPRPYGLMPFLIPGPYESELSTGPKSEKPSAMRRALRSFAESEGFEPPEAFTSTVFKTAALNHSANFPMMYPSLKGIAKVDKS